MPYLFFALLSMVHAAPVITGGACNNELIRHALVSYFSSGTVHTGKFNELSTTLREAEVAPIHIENLETILGAAERGDLKIQPLADLAQMIKNDTFNKSLYICVAKKDCELDIARDNSAAHFIKYHNRSPQMSFTPFAELPSVGSSEWMEFELHSHNGANEFVASGRPNAIVVRPFRETVQRPGVIQDPLVIVNTFEGEVLHELVHAVDAELLRMWVGANLALLAKGEKADELFAKFARISPFTGRVFVATEFETIFSETRGYQVTLEVWKLFNPDPALIQQMTTQMFFTAWLYTVRDSSEKFDAAKLAGIPSEGDFKAALASPGELGKLMSRASQAMQATLQGPGSWRTIIVSTINRAH